MAEVLEPLRLRIRATTLAEPRDEWLQPTWHAVRPVVLGELAALDLLAVVEGPAGAVPLAEHPIDRAGLVRVHPPGDPAPNDAELDRLDDLHGRADLYDDAVADATGLERLYGLPLTLRSFCGQHAPGDVHRFMEVVRRFTANGKPHPAEGCPTDDIEGMCWAPYQVVGSGAPPPAAGCWTRAASVPYRPGWLDRPRTWRSPDGSPRFTVEPYVGPDGDLPLLAEVARDVIGEGLPLRLDGPPRPGVRDPDAVLLVFAWVPPVEPLPAEFRPMIRNESLDSVFAGQLHGDHRRMRHRDPEFVATDLSLWTDQWRRLGAGEVA
ncbi:hypothetical protein [Pseudonocardia sp.]|uniref:hypothetical protein n=1 Tax=Pseudonocardia sp. TaxID=60912 RepID=UPI00262176FB|nr:hypothetical protein [Pseudonocardia sp.]